MGKISLCGECTPPQIVSMGKTRGSDWGAECWIMSLLAHSCFPSPITWTLPIFIMPECLPICGTQISMWETRAFLEPWIFYESILKTKRRLCDGRMCIKWSYWILQKVRVDLNPSPVTFSCPAIFHCLLVRSCFHHWGINAKKWLEKSNCCCLCVCVCVLVLLSANGDLVYSHTWFCCCTLFAPDNTGMLLWLDQWESTTCYTSVWQASPGKDSNPSCDCFFGDL